jgi:predicted alpha/beta hydrolase family esterase
MHRMNAVPISPKGSTSGGVFPIPGWLLFLSLLVGELALIAMLTRTGVARGWWSDLAGGLLFLVIPLVVRLLIVVKAYILSRRKGMPLASVQRLQGAAWWRFFLAEYWHFCKQSFLHLPFPALFRSRADRGDISGSGAVVLLQHGYLHNGAVWNPLTRALESQGFRVFTIDQPLFGSIDTLAARLAAKVGEIRERTGVTQVTLIAHSMGGLIARAYLRNHGDKSVNELITLGSPHHGTFHAYMALGENGKQMRPGNAWLKTLAQSRVNVPFTSIYSVYDTLISPQTSSRMDEASNVELTGVGHVAMFASGAVQAKVFGVLTRSAMRAETFQKEIV